jgi:hypothetical protein
MSKSRFVITTVLVGAILAGIAAAVFFLLDFPRTALNYWAFGSVLFADLFFCAGLALIRVLGPQHSRVFPAAGGITVLSLYFIAAVLAAVLSGSFEGNLKGFILLEAAALAVCAVLLLLIAAVSGRIASANAGDYGRLQNGEFNAPGRGEL